MVRLKKKYILAEISFGDGLIDESLSKYAVQDTIKDTIKKVYGDFGLACILMSLRVKYLNPFTNVVFIACSRDHHKMLQCSLTFIKNVKDRACVFKTLHIGGTIRSCQRFLVQHNKAQLHHLLDQCKTPVIEIHFFGHKIKISCRDEIYKLNEQDTIFRFKQKKPEREKVSAVLDKATNEATSLDPVSTWKRRTKALAQVKKEDTDNESDSSLE